MVHGAAKGWEGSRDGRAAEGGGEQQRAGERQKQQRAEESKRETEPNSRMIYLAGEGGRAHRLAPRRDLAGEQREQERQRSESRGNTAIVGISSVLADSAR